MPGAASDDQRESLRPVQGADRSLRRRLTLKDEFILALFPTVTVLAVIGFMELFTEQRLLFSSLASSAFLIYLDPQHGTNQFRTLVTAHLVAAAIGLGVFLLLGPGYWSAGAAMVTAIVVMIALDVVHPPAVSTSLIFSFKPGQESNLVLFALAVLVTAVLVALERFVLWFLAHRRPGG